MRWRRAIQFSRAIICDLVDMSTSNLAQPTACAPGSTDPQCACQAGTYKVYSADGCRLYARSAYKAGPGNAASCLACGSRFYSLYNGLLFGPAHDGRFSASGGLVLGGRCQRKGEPSRGVCPAPGPGRLHVHLVHHVEFQLSMEECEIVEDTVGLHPRARFVHLVQRFPVEHGLVEDTQGAPPPCASRPSSPPIPGQARAR